LRVDLHNHTTLCNHATSSMEEYILKAIENKIDIYGFSDHAPMNFDKKYRMNIEKRSFYEKTALDLKEKYKKNIKILLAYEVDYLNGYILDDIIKSDVDYLIGSVHFINKWGFDNPQFINRYKNQDIDKIWEDYFDIITNLAKSNLFDIVGHLDLIKVFNFIPKKDIKKIVYLSLQEIKRSNMVIEINSSGFLKPIKEQYPSKDILQLAYELDIPITFSSDAHHLKYIGNNYSKVVKLAKEVGYSKCAIFEKRERALVNF
jgi:histidinol-phosphatase (PHP family)